MAEDKKKIIVYADWITKFEALEDDEAGKLIKHFFRYINDLNPTYPDRITEISFIDIQNTLKRDLIKWEKRAEKSRENGMSGGRPKNLSKPKETNQVILEPTKPVNVNDSDSVSDSVKVSVIKKEKEIKKKIPFSQSHIFDKVKFKDEFKEWSNTKLNYYYNSALAWSEEGGKKINWVTTIKNWELRDRLEGKEIAQDKNTMPKQPRID